MKALIPSERCQLDLLNETINRDSKEKESGRTYKAAQVEPKAEKRAVSRRSAGAGC